MKFLLTMFICSVGVQGTTCLPPKTFDILYNDGYDCMLDGYKKSRERLIKIGREEINKYKIYIKFGCYEDHSNKPTA